MDTADIAIKCLILQHFSFMFPYVGFHLLLLLLLHRPPTLSVLWSIRLSIHSQKWLWHLLKRPVECSGLKGYPMLWPKTTRFFFFSFSFPSKIPLWHCALACWLSDQSLNIFKLPPMKGTPSYRYPDMTTHTLAGRFTSYNTLRCKTQKIKHQKEPVWNQPCRPALSMRLQNFMTTPKPGSQRQIILYRLHRLGYALCLQTLTLANSSILTSACLLSLRNHDLRFIYERQQEMPAQLVRC